MWSVCKNWASCLGIQYSELAANIFRGRQPLIESVDNKVIRIGNKHSSPGLVERISFYKYLHSNNRGDSIITNRCLNRFIFYEGKRSNQFGRQEQFCYLEEQKTGLCRLKTIVLGNMREVLKVCYSEDLPGCCWCCLQENNCAAVISWNIYLCFWSLKVLLPFIICCKND